jgi:hypothetical protein
MSTSIATETATEEHHEKSFIQRHMLTLVACVVLLSWVFFYMPSNPDTHWGSFFGNAIADWSGVVASIICTRILYERGAPGCRHRKAKDKNLVIRWIKNHTLTVFFGVTLIGWIILFARMSATSKWGQVVGNVVSEWTQILGMIWLTKMFYEEQVKKHQKSSQPLHTQPVGESQLPHTGEHSFPGAEPATRTAD